MHTNTPPSDSTTYHRLDERIVQALAQRSPLSVQELTLHLQHKREKAVSTALNALLLKGQVQRVGISNRFRLSPTQAARSADL